MNKIHKPLTLEQAEKLANSQRELTVTITVNFEDLLKGIDAFNEMVDETVCVPEANADETPLGVTDTAPTLKLWVPYNAPVDTPVG